MAPLGAFANAALVGDLGTLPRLGPGVLARLGLDAYPARWSAYVAYFPAATRAVGHTSGGDEIGGRFQLWSVGAQFCWQHRPVSQVELGVCAGPELDVMRGEAFGVTSPSSGNKAWLSGVLELGVAHALLPHLALGVRAAGVLPSLRENFSVHGLGVIHRPAPAALRVSLGLELSL
jgi:hypothetical protein